MTRFRARFLTWTAVLCMLTTGAVEAASPNALTNWQAALRQFEQAGAAAGTGDFAAAKIALAAGATNLPAPYQAMAGEFGARLEAALALSMQANDPRRVKALAELCASLRAYDAAVRLQSSIGDAEDLADDPTYAWRLFEMGDTAAALKEYRRRLGEETVESFRAHYQEQLRLVQQRETHRTNVAFSLQLVQQHYLRGFEEKADVFGAARELYRVLPHARTGSEAVDVHQWIIKCLTDLGDEAGRDAWEDKILRDLKSETEACASVYLNRGLRAFGRPDYPRALELLGQVRSNYAETEAWGDAQYTHALILQRQEHYDEAVREYSRIFPSKVNDYKLDPEKSEDCKNYRHRAALRISECYERRHDYTQALAWTEAARDRYIYNSFCKTCLKDSKAAIDKRIADLQAELAKAPAAKAP